MNFRSTIALSFLCLGAVACQGESSAPPSMPTTADAESPATPPAAVIPASVDAAFTESQTDAAALKQITTCTVDTLNGVNPPVTTVPASEKIVVIGWITSEAFTSIPSFDLLLVGPTSYRLTAPVNVERQDVADYLKNPAALKSGFNISVNPAGVSPGTYLIALLHEADGNEVACQTPGKLTIQ